MALDPQFQCYLLIGQSNMAGRGVVDAESRITHPRVVMLTKALLWQPAVDPIHFDKAIAGVGPGLTFGKIMAEARPTVRIGLIPCAVGGTSIRVWVPGAVDAATQTRPYDDMLVRARAALQFGVLSGILWHQGEADRADWAAYGDLLAELVTRVRADLSCPSVPFIAGELTPFTLAMTPMTVSFNATVHEQMRQMPSCACVSAEGLSHGGDELHYHALAARELGRRYAQAMLALQHKG